jgi:sugar phosphate isomerase/epimerase
VTLATPSYLAPGTWLENLRLAAGIAWIRGVELLFFAYDEDARRTMALEAPAIAALAGRFEYSIHLPDPLGDADEELVELAAPFARLFVAHPPASGDASDAARWAKLLGSWRERYGERFALEYTGRSPFAAAERELPALPLCPDAGKLVLDGEDPARWMAARAGRVVELHAHAARGGKDHLPLSGEEPWLPEVLGLAEAGDWRVVLEVFSLEAAEASARAVERARGSKS